MKNKYVKDLLKIIVASRRRFLFIYIYLIKRKLYINQKLYKKKIKIIKTPTMALIHKN